jgi:hypothetical protein
MTATLTWSGTITASSSVAHGGETRGTITLLRRELVVQPDGNAVYVPLISGNSFRGVLRRIGEEMLRDVLGYEGELSLPAAHALRGGGALARTAAEPLSGARLQRLRALVPHVGVFGCAGGGRIIDGCLQVGKVLPEVAELAHLLPPGPPGPSAARATQLETYVRRDDTSAHQFAGVIAPVPVGADGQPDTSRVPPAGPDTTLLMMYRIETFPAGTTFHTWARLIRATPLEASFFTDVLTAFGQSGHLGGRTGIGHGLIKSCLQPAAGPPPGALADWRAVVTGHRDAALAALQALT